MKLLETLKQKLLEGSKSLPQELFVISNLWSCERLIKPSQAERLFTESMWLAMTSTSIGRATHSCQKATPKLFDLENKIGSDGRSILCSVKDRSLSIAILDACYGALPAVTPNQQIKLTGSLLDKALYRSEIVVNETIRAAKIVAKQALRVLLVGVVNLLVNSLKHREVSLCLTDLNETVINTKVEGILVKHGDKNLSLIQEVDVVLLTGMTLVTDTLDDILLEAKKHNKPVVMYAQTGSHLASTYIELGIETVIAEPYPWYIMPGDSIVKVYRQKI